MIYQTLGYGEIFSELFCVCSLAYGIRGLWKLLRNTHWSNKKLLTYDDLFSTNQWYTVEDMSENREVIIHITTDALKSMNDDMKKDLIKKFIFNTNDHCTISGDRHQIINTFVDEVGYYGKMRKTFTTCVDKSFGFFVSCVPNITNGTFVVKNISSSFSDILSSKNDSKLYEAMLLAIILGTSIVMLEGVFGFYDKK